MKPISKALAPLVAHPVVLVFAFASIMMFPREAAAQPTIGAGGILNGASYARPGLPNAGIAQGSIFIVFGKNLGPATLVQVSAFPLPTSAGLAGTSIRVTVGGTTVDAIMLYTLATQVAAVLPSNAPVGTGSLTLTYNGESSAPEPITVVKSSFGIFTTNQAGSGAAVLQNVNSQTDQPVNGATKPARPGQVVIVWGTGIGPVAGDEAKGPLPGDMKSTNIHVWVGAKEAKITYRGRSGCCTGLDQLVFVVPEGVEGCAVPLYIQIDNVVSNFAVIAIAKSGSACADNGLSASVIEQATQNGGIRTGSLFVGYNKEKSDRTQQDYDTLGAGFTKISLDALLHAAPAGKPGFCYVTQFPGYTPPLPVYLDGGSTSAATPVGPFDLYMATKGVHFLSFRPGPTGTPGAVVDGTRLKGGKYTFTVAGGADVGPVTASIDYPRIFAWDIDSITSVDRSQPLHVTWTGGADGAIVSVMGRSAVSPSPNGDIGVGFNCWEDATKGSMTVPAAVLSTLPVSYTDDRGDAHGSLQVVHSFQQLSFEASGIDYGQIYYNDSFLRRFVPYH